MAEYTMSHVRDLLQVKPHVIRYWEQEIPLIRSSRDIYGRRIYSGRDIQILLRLKHLLYNRRFTLEGAKQELYRELTENDEGLHGRISQLRSELLQLLFMVREDKNESVPPP
ncbi:MAG: MerR family transcriptional regulator [Treponema sp.]|nr:MerR family transcriptional regulator [Treponema sp.]